MSPKVFRGFVEVLKILFQGFLNEPPWDFLRYSSGDSFRSTSWDFYRESTEDLHIKFSAFQEICLDFFSIFFTNSFKNISTDFFSSSDFFWGFLQKFQQVICSKISSRELANLYHETHRKFLSKYVLQRFIWKFFQGILQEFLEKLLKKSEKSFFSKKCSCGSVRWIS